MKTNVKYLKTMMSRRRLSKMATARMAGISTPTLYAVLRDPKNVRHTGALAAALGVEEKKLLIFD